MRNSLLKIAVFSLALIFLCKPKKIDARANDSAFSGVSGTPKPMRGEHRSIAMQSEKIAILADAKGYSIQVDFVFRNDGGKTTVQMGFPESSYEDAEAAKRTSFLRFATFVDGRKVVARRLVLPQDSPETRAFWLKTVDFGARQTRRVRVSYRSPWGGNTEWGTRRALVYDFTGQNWRGKVERSDLEIRVAEPGLWVGLPLFGNQPLAMGFEATPQRAIFRKTWRNWQAQGAFMFGLTPVVPFWMDDRNSLGARAGTSAAIRNSRTFRIGAVPRELPRGTESADGFVRHGVAYVSLSHLESRLNDFADELHKTGRFKPKVALGWNSKTRVSTLIAGNQQLAFAPQVPVEGSQLRPILLHAQYGDTLYVPIAPLAKKWGLSFVIAPGNRVFDLQRGTWTGQ